MKVISTDHKEPNNLTSLIFKKWIYIFLFVHVKINIVFDLFLIRKFFYFTNTRHPLYILVPGERLVFIIFDSVMYTYTCKKAEML